MGDLFATGMGADMNQTTTPGKQEPKLKYNGTQRNQNRVRDLSMTSGHNMKATLEPNNQLAQRKASTKSDYFLNLA